jgi:hypothetical protein
MGQISIVASCQQKLVWVWHSIELNHHCLRMGRHSWYQSITCVIHRMQQYFQEPTVRNRLDAHIRTIVVLTVGKLTAIYFLHLLYAIYYFVTMHLWQGQKVSILLSGDVNPEPIPLKMRLAWGQSLSCGRGCVFVVWLATTAHPEHGDLEMSCGIFLKTWIHSFNICSVVHTTLNAWASLGG